MTATAPAQSKITYTSANVDWELFHRQFDDALSSVRAQFGRDYPLYIAGEAVPSSAKPIVDTSPIDTRIILGNFASATGAHVHQAVTAARAAQAAWGRSNWRDRVNILRRAAELIRERKFELAAVMSVEVGKSRLESMGDAEEFFADFHADPPAEQPADDGFAANQGAPIRDRCELVRRKFQPRQHL